MHFQSLPHSLFALVVVATSVNASFLSSRHSHHRNAAHQDNALIASSNNTNSSSPQTVSAVAASWFAGWHDDVFGVCDISFEKYTDLIYSFASTTTDGTSVNVAASDAEIIPDFVAACKENNVSAHIGIGGWGDSIGFSTNVGSATNRSNFVSAVTKLVQLYGFDGVHFDWEYPNHQGIGCNAISPDDTANFLSFLQELRQDPVGSNLTLTAAVTITPFADSTGNPSSNVSEFANVFNWIAIMDYDIYGTWSPTTGPNSPLNDSCAPAAAREGSAVSAVNSWFSAGFPLHQMVLGVPAYAHTFRVSNEAALVSGSTTELALYATFDSSNPPLGDSLDSTSSVDVCGITEPQGGTWRFNSMIESNFLTQNGTASPGMVRTYDNCSQTPYLYDPSTQVMFAYDDAESFAAKGAFIKSMNLRGFAMWETEGDSNDLLLDAIRSGVGFEDDDGC